MRKPIPLHTLELLAHGESRMPIQDLQDDAWRYGSSPTHRPSGPMSDAEGLRYAHSKLTRRFSANKPGLEADLMAHGARFPAGESSASGSAQVVSKLYCLSRSQPMHHCSCNHDLLFLSFRAIHPWLRYSTALNASLCLLHQLSLWVLAVSEVHQAAVHTWF